MRVGYNILQAHFLNTNEVPRALLVYLIVGTQTWNNNEQMNLRGLHQRKGAGPAASGQSLLHMLACDPFSFAKLL
jgi:hypothetical protein